MSKEKNCTECGRPLFDQTKCLTRPLCDECFQDIEQIEQDEKDTIMEASESIY